MANNAQFHGIQSFRPHITPLGPPQVAPPSMSMQFRPGVPVPVVPSQQSQSYNPLASQQFQQIGHTNIDYPYQSQQFQFSQQVQQLPVRPGFGGPGLPPSQAIPIPDVQANRPSIAVSPLPVQNVQISNTYVSGHGGPPMPLSSSYTFGASAGGQVQRGADALTQHQPTSQTNASNFPVGGQSWPPDGSQGMTSAVSVQHIAEQPSATAICVSPEVLESNLADKLPSDWLEHTSRAGKKYYYNKKTKLSSWEKPPELMTSMERADSSTDWKEYKSPDGRKYYYNRVTKQSKWTIPDELKLAREQMNIQSSRETQAGNGNSPASSAVSLSGIQAPPPNAVTSSFLAHGVVSSPIQLATVSAVVNSQPAASSGPSVLPSVPSTATKNAIEIQTPVETVPSLAVVSGSGETSDTLVTTSMAQMSNINDKKAQEAVNTDDGVSAGVVKEVEKGEGGTGEVDVISSEQKTIASEPFVYANKLEAKNAFKALLDSANVGSDWIWDQAMRVIINDHRYGALRTLGERKQAFHEFLVQRKKQEAEERRARQKKAQEDFRILLEECKELTLSTRWSKAVAIFEDDERFKAIERDKDREDLFKDHLVELEKKVRAKALEEYKRNRTEYLNFLKSCDFITASSQWRKVQDRLEADERCSCLEKIDRLEIFQEYIRDLEREEEQQRKLRMDELRKTERKNRDEFRKLMEEHVAAGILTAETHWRDYCIKVKDLPSYIAVSSNAAGSTAKDLFEDVAEELQKQYLEDKARIKEALKLRKIALSSTWTFEDFKASIIEDISSPPISDANLKLAFEELQKKVKEKEEKEAKRRKRLADDFYNLLCASKDITASSKWENCKQLLEDRQESWFVEEEGFLKDIFEKYMAELKEKAKEKEQKRRDDKAKRDRDAKDREKKKQKHFREKGRGFETINEKDGTHGQNADKTGSYVLEENKRSGRDRDKKHRKRHLGSGDDLSVDNEKDRSKTSHRHSSDQKKSKQMDHRSGSDPDNESRHKRHKKDRRSGSYRSGDNEELKDREFGEDGEVW